MSRRIVKLSRQFLLWFCPPALSEGIEGDLLEQFESDLKQFGESKAARRFLWNTIKFFRPGIFLRNKISIEVMNLVMLRSYFRISYRHLAKNKTFATINILGLAAGMAAALLIYEYVSFERSFDTFHAQADQIYRVTTEWNKSITPEDKRATTVAWSGPGAKEEFPEVLEYARFAPMESFTGYNAVSYDNTEINEHDIYLADPGFLRIFSFKLLKGDINKALAEPTNVVITERIAKKYFRGKDPIGKELIIDTHGNLAENNFKVTGVVQDPPDNSNINFDFLVSYNVIHKDLHNGSTYWHWDYTYAYLLLHPKTDVKALERKISALRLAKFGKEMEYYKDAIDFKLQPIKDIHLFSSLKGELKINSDGRSLYFLMLVGICIILSAYINYVNLSTVKAVERRTEIGIRKVVGSSKGQLTLQLLVESFVLNILAVFIAFILFRLSVPLIEQLFNIQWPSWRMSFISIDFILFVTIILPGGIVLSALYPAFVLTSFKPAEVLKGKGPGSSGERGWSLRKSLIVLQFVFCIAFTVGTYALYQQMKFMKSYDLGMNIEQVIAVQGYGFQSYEVYEQFRDRLSNASFVRSVGASSSAPGEEILELGLRPKVAVAGKTSGSRELKMVMVDEDYFNTLEVKFLSGQNFDRSINADGKSVIINEAALAQLGFKDPQEILNEGLSGLDEKDLKVIGVIKNYNQRSLKNGYEPIVFLPMKNNNFGWNKRYFFVRLSPAQNLEQRQHQISEIQKAWKSTSPEKPFQYFFLDSHFDQQYKADTAYSSLFLFFAALAIFIACLGLFGLVAYTTIQRTKEIGVRKVLGASVQNILTLLSRDFIKLIIVAMIIAVPSVIGGLQYWLDQYAFRMALSVWLFIIPLFSIFMIALLTIVLKSLKVATANPVDSLRYE